MRETFKAIDDREKLQYYEDPLESASITGDDSVMDASSSRAETKRPDGAADLWRVIALPIFNIAVTCVVIGLTIYVYQTADGQTTDLKLAGMNVPTILSLLMTIAKMFVAGGITYAISEYKWVRLQNDGGSLAMLDVYDACSRGLGGIARVASALRFDRVIVVTLLFQIGLMAMGPASQQILSTKSSVVCSRDDAYIWYTNYTSADLTSMKYSNTLQKLKGLEREYAAAYGYGQASRGFVTIPNYTCSQNSLNCTYDGVGGLATEAVCTPGDLKSEVVDVHTNNKTTIASYLGLSKNDSRSPPYVDVPQTFYHGSMLGRTHYDLANLTMPLYTNATYDPTLRRYFGEQKFVLVLSDEGNLSTYIPADKEPKVLICTLQTSYNVSNLVYRSEQIEIYNQTSVPLDLDYDLLSNNTYWKKANSLKTDYRAMNAYATQLTHMKLLVGNSAFFQQLAADWLIYGYNATNDGSAPVKFLRAMLHNTDLVSLYGIPNDPIFASKGSRCWVHLNMYDVNKVAYYAFALAFLVPLIWWVAVWIISLHQTNGISRGNSQIALLVTGFTPAVKHQLRGMSHAGQHVLFKKAKEIDVVFGEHRSTGHIAFGQPAELDPIRTKRESSSLS
ncbi:hypothetical protein BX666DRAFT_2126007 [Dichotomocladium elegans]|nr:hypothetical protein BX666DRAFT_2126007 [Dichotomocladium elegans]